MDRLVIKGNRKLSGEVVISGAKNAAVAVIPAAIMAQDVCVIDNLPYIEDVKCLYTTLNKMGADIIVKEQEATINGITPLKGEEVTATDLRAGAALIIAGLIAKGKTTINDVEHILRGYEGIIEKLSNTKADIKLEEKTCQTS